MARLEKKSINITSLTNTYRKVGRTNVLMMEKLTSLTKELKESFKGSKQEEEMVKLLKMLESLEEVMTRPSLSKGLL